MAVKKDSLVVQPDEAKEIIKSAKLEPLELALTCLMNGLFLGWSVVDLSICVFAQQQLTTPEKSRLGVDLLRSFFSWKPVAPFISHLMLCVAPLVLVPIGDAWKHASRLIRGVAQGPARTQSLLVIGGFIQLVILIAVLVAYVMPAEKAAALLTQPAASMIEESLIEQALAVCGQLILGHSILNTLSAVGISLLFLRWAWSASDEELATLSSKLGVGGENQEGEGDQEGDHSAGGTSGAPEGGKGSKPSGEVGREVSPYADTAQWKVSASRPGIGRGKGKPEAKAAVDSGEEAQGGQEGEGGGRGRRRRGRGRTASKGRSDSD